MCSFISGYIDNCYDHIIEEHKDWRGEKGLPGHDELPGVEELKGQPQADEQVQGSLYTRPEWKEEFRRDFSKIVVEKCSLATKEAIASNEEIKVLEIFIYLSIEASCVYRISGRRRESERR